MTLLYITADDMTAMMIDMIDMIGASSVIIKKVMSNGVMLTIVVAVAAAGVVVVVVLVAAVVVVVVIVVVAVTMDYDNVYCCYYCYAIAIGSIVIHSLISITNIQLHYS